MTAYQEFVWGWWATRLHAIEVQALSRNLRGVAVWRRALWQRTWKPR